MFKALGLRVLENLGFRVRNSTRMNFGGLGFCHHVWKSQIMPTPCLVHWPKFEATEAVEGFRSAGFLVYFVQNDSCKVRLDAQVFVPREGERQR